MAPGEGAPAERRVDFDELTDAAWLLAAVAVFLDPAASHDRLDSENAATQLLLAYGLLQEDESGSPVPTAHFSEVVDGREDACRNAIRSMLSQVSGIAAHGFGGRWQGQEAETLLAQGRASAMSGRFLATDVVPLLDGLSTRFAGGGVLLDVGVGVAELASSFCAEFPEARVIGLDPFPLAIELAQRTIGDHGVADRVELRAHGVEDLSAESEVDLAWLPTPFVPQPEVEEGVVRIWCRSRTPCKRRSPPAQRAGRGRRACEADAVSRATDAPESA